MGVPGVGIGAGSLWRGNLGGILGQQPSRVTIRTIWAASNQYLGGAGAYCSALTPADYAANRLMIRSMAAYVAHHEHVLAAIRKCARPWDAFRRRISAFPCAWAGGQPEPLVFDPIHRPDSRRAAVRHAAARRRRTSPPRTRKPSAICRPATQRTPHARPPPGRVRLVMRASLAAQGATLNADTAAAVAASSFSSAWPRAPCSTAAGTKSPSTSRPSKQKPPKSPKSSDAKNRHVRRRRLL